MEVNERKLFNIVGGTVSPHFDKIFPKGTERLADCIRVFRLTKNRLNTKKGELWAYVDIKKCPVEAFLDYTEFVKEYDLTEELYSALRLIFSLICDKLIDWETRRVEVAKFLKEWEKVGSKQVNT